MPWTPKDATHKTKKAKTPKQRRMWSDIANSMLGRGASDASAIRGANSVIAKRSGRA